MAEITDKDHGFAAMMKRLKDAAGTLTVGVHEAEGEHAAEGGSGGLTLLQVAAFHEFGTSRTPRRSFIADWADELEQQHREQMRKMAQAVLKGAVPSLEQGLSRLGALYQGEVQRRIAQGIQPALSDATIKRKGSSVPLIDTGQLRSSILWRIQNGK